MADAAGSRRRLVAEDIYNIVLVGDAQISPDGSQVAFVRSVPDKKTDDYRSSIYVVPTNGGAPRRFTSADAKDSSPRWAPDGKTIAFLSNRSGKNQIWTIPFAGGEATQLTDYPEGVNGISWSPDGSTIAFVSKLEPAQLEKKEADEEGKKEEESDVVRITKIRFRADGTPGFLDNKPTHIWCVPSAGGDPWQVTSGDYYDSRPRWSPNGQEIVYSSNRSEDREYNNVSEIWAVNVRGGEPRPIATGDDAHFGQPVYAPDGGQIAFAGFRHPVGGPQNHNVWVATSTGSDARDLTQALDRTVGDGVTNDTSIGGDSGLVWSASGDAIYFPIEDHGSSHVYRVGTSSGDTSLVIGGERRISGLSMSADGSRFAFVSGNGVNPNDVFVCNSDGSDERQLTQVNADFLSSVALSQPEEIRFKSHAEDQAEIQGWVMKPVGFEPGKKYPMVLEIHGGPHAQYGNAFFLEFQLLAAQGNVVLFTNPRGSQGYGQAFTQYTRGAWGEKDMPDQMAAVDYVIEQGYVDPNRLGVTGGSYGGFMTNWVIGHTDRFKAAVTQRCVSNLYSFYGTSDIGFNFGEYETGGKPPWEDREAYVRMSPITYMHNVTTPLLIIHSEQDYRCPIEQAEQVFVLLKKLRREVEFVRFPNESHGLSRGGHPKHRVERLNYITGWFDSHL